MCPATKEINQERSAVLSLLVRGKKHLSLMLTVALVLAVAVPLFHVQLYEREGLNDMTRHVSITVYAAETDTWPIYTILHRLLYALAFRSTETAALSRGLLILLSLAIALKTALTYYVLQDRSTHLLRGIMTVALALVMPVFNWWKFPHIYLGQIPPNVWHNPTTILVIPLSLALFLVSHRFLGRPRTTTAFAVSGMIILNLLIKPSYVIAIVPVLLVRVGIMVCEHKGISRAAAISYSIVILCPAAMILAMEALATFYGDSPYAAGSRLAVMPFAVWKLYTPTVLGSLCVSIAFPLMVVFLYWPATRCDSTLLLAWGVFAVAVVEFSLLAEAGPWLYEGNFLWGPVVAAYILFVASARLLLSQPYCLRFVVALLVLCAHVSSGIFYFIRLLSSSLEAFAL